MWDWLAKTGCRLKSTWPGWRFLKDKPGFEEAVAYRCFACQEDYNRENELFIDGRKIGACMHCPIDFIGDGSFGYCTSHDSIFLLWSNSEYDEERKQLAAKIRDLPWRENTKKGENK